MIGAIMSTWGRSCSEPILCCVSELCPPMCSTGLSDLKAVAMPVTALVQPGPAVVTTQPNLPVCLRIAIGGVGRHLLVANIDDADTLVQTAIVDVDDVPAAQGEDRIDTLGF